MTPTVSICIPTYNAEAYILESLESALAQHFPSVEVIVVDNCSSDRTYEIISGFVDPRIRHYRNEENIGAEANWNRCLSLASGKYVKLLCADDVLDPMCIAREVETLEGEGGNGITLVTCGRRIIGEKGQILIRRRCPLKPGRYARQAVLAASARHGTNVVGEPSAVLFRRSDSAVAGSFDGRIPYMIDLDYWVRLLELGDMVVLGEVLCGFRASRKAWSGEIGKRQICDFVRFIRSSSFKGHDEAKRGDMVAAYAMAVLNYVARTTVVSIVARIKMRDEWWLG
ncbi:MAG: glycosyltransferase family 2 protein [Acidobacteriota bacterium]